MAGEADRAERAHPCDAVEGLHHRRGRPGPCHLQGARAATRSVARLLCSLQLIHRGFACRQDAVLQSSAPSGRVLRRLRVLSTGSQHFASMAHEDDTVSHVQQSTSGLNLQRDL